MIPLIVITGPTATGKTALSVKLAKIFGGEIVSADSMQIYKQMDIATAKPSPEETDGVPHHLMGHVDMTREYSVAEYVSEAGAVIRDIYKRGKQAFLVGGTGLYINSLIDGISFSEQKGDEAVREKYRRYADEFGNEHLHTLLKEADPEYAEKLHPNNRGRVIRALEMYELSGITMTRALELSKRTPSIYTPCMIGLDYSDRKLLYENIERRIDIMLQKGLLREAGELFEKGFSGTAVQAIGYKELFGYFEGKIALDEAIENIKKSTRRYAKRQLTWFRRDGRINWLFVDKLDAGELLGNAETIIQNTGIT